jgi:hypothetical protein
MVQGHQVDLLSLYRAVEVRGGMRCVDAAKKWHDVAAEVKIGKPIGEDYLATDISKGLREVFRAYLKNFAEEQVHAEVKKMPLSSTNPVRLKGARTFLDEKTILLYSSDGTPTPAFSEKGG